MPLPIPSRPPDSPSAIRAAPHVSAPRSFRAGGRLRVKGRGGGSSWGCRRAAVGRSSVGSGCRSRVTPSVVLSRSRRRGLRGRPASLAPSARRPCGPSSSRPCSARWAVGPRRLQPRRWRRRGPQTAPLPLRGLPAWALESHGRLGPPTSSRRHQQSPPRGALPLPPLRALADFSTAAEGAQHGCLRPWQNLLPLSSLLALPLCQAVRGAESGWARRLLWRPCLLALPALLALADSLIVAGWVWHRCLGPRPCSPPLTPLLAFLPRMAACGTSPGLVRSQLPRPYLAPLPPLLTLADAWTVADLPSLLSPLALEAGFGCG